jgi:Big-like domain-containing protein
MRGSSSRRLAATAAATLTTLACAATASAQAPPAGLGDQLFSTGGEITVEVRPATAGLTSELRLYNADGTFTPVATNRELGRIVTLPARPTGEELLFGILVHARRRLPGSNHVFKLGPGDRNPDGLAHGRVVASGERQFDVGFEDLFDGGDRDYDDNVFRFSGGLAPNRVPLADDQALTVGQGGSLPITLTGSDPDGDTLTFTVADAPHDGTLSGSGAKLTYTPRPDFSGTDTFGFKADDGKSPPVEGRITIKVTPTGVAPPPTATGSSTVLDLGDCPAGELTLLNVRRVGRRVLLTGLAEQTLAGAPVSIVEGGVVVARTLIRPDGTIRLRVAIPKLRGGRILRYQARLGALRSRNVRLRRRRRMITTSAKLRNGRIVIAGRVVGAPKRGTRPLVRLLARPRGCGTRKTQIGRARLHRDGTFRVSGKPLAGIDIAVYQARARLHGKRVTFSLPQTIARR